jgi:ADP-ribose pyrophosphatase YjhB (NUDIX family)
MQQKALAYIIRPRLGQPHQLLVFAHLHQPEVPLQVPAGTVAANETPEAAAWREVEEESGLTNLRLIRKLGVHHLQQANPVEQHYYLLKVKADLPDRWMHEVQGEGLDAGLVFAYEWAEASTVALLETQAVYLNETAVPELFGPRELD